MPRANDEIAEIERVLGAGDDELADEVQRLLQKRLNVILYGPPGTGKTRVSFELQRRWRIQYGPDSVFPVTFHPSYGYEDFVRGYRPATTSDKEQPRFELQDGILLQAASRARVGPTLLAIDEINRGDVSRIFGELITYIETDKRDSPFFVSSRRPREGQMTIPANLYILGTMNSADKSVSLLDVALRRRFALRELPPDPSAFARSPNWLAEIAGLDLGALLVGLNNRLVRAEIEHDRLLGHALLGVDVSSADPITDLRERLVYDVYPLVTEYFFLERSRVSSVLGGLVDESGRMRNDLDERAFVEELGRITNSATAAAPTEGASIAEGTADEEG